MSTIDLYVNMGFARSWAERAPSDPEIGIPWLLRATTMNTMPKRFARQGAFNYTFHNSLVEFMDSSYTVKDYDPTIEIIRLVNSLACVWVSLSDPNIRFVEERHDTPPVDTPLRAYQIYELPVLDLSIDAMPRDIRRELREHGSLQQEQLSGDWDFHTGAENGNVWLALLRLSNRHDPSVRFCPAYPKPDSITSQYINRFRTEMKSKISLFCLCVEDPRFTVHNILHTQEDEFSALMNAAGDHGETLRRLRDMYWSARQILRDRLRDWKRACIAPMEFLKVTYVNGRAHVHMALSEWSFTELRTDMQRTVVPFYFSVIFNHMFGTTIPNTTTTVSEGTAHLFEEQVPVYDWVCGVENRGRHPGWWTRHEEGGFVWSYSLWGARVRGFPPNHAGGILYTSPGSGKTVLMTRLCACRKEKTLIIVPNRARIKYWIKHFHTFGDPEHLSVLGLERNVSPWDDDADVVVATWTTYKNHPNAHGPWERLIIDDAHKAKSSRERVDFLKQLDARFVWLLTNISNISPIYRELLGIPTNRLDAHIISPNCDISERLSPVEFTSHHFHVRESHERLRKKFFETAGNNAKVINKWYRTVQSQPELVPHIHYASTKWPVGWNPICEREVVQENVRQRMKEPCSICYDECKESVITPCDHVFCSNCMERHMENSCVCPLCRGGLDICDVVISNEKHRNLIYDTKSHTWVGLSDEIRSTLEGYETNVKEIEEFIKSKQGHVVFISEHPMKINHSTRRTETWSEDYCLCMTYKRAFKQDMDISKADHLICLGPINAEENDILSRQIRTLHSDKPSYVHVCNY